MRGYEKAISGFVLSVAGSVPVTAADAAPEEADDDQKSLIEVIVIEGDRAEPITLKNTSYSIEVFTQEDLVRGTDRDVTDLLLRVPNVTTDPFSNAPIIRGVPNNGISRFGQAGLIVNTLTFVDGYYTPRTQNLWDTTQAEVLRGPETLTGGGAMGGMITINSNGPTESPEGIVRVDWATEADDRRLGVAYGGPVSDSIGYRVAGYTRQTDGFVDNVTRSDSAWNGRDERALRGRLDWHPQEDTSITFRTERIENHSSGGNSTLASPYEDPYDRETTADAPADGSETSTDIAVEVRHRINDSWSAELRLGATRRTSHGRGDFDGREFPGATVRWHADEDWSGVQGRLFFEQGPWQAFFRQYALRADISNAYWEGIFAVDDPEDALAPFDVIVDYTEPTPTWWFIGTQIGARREVGPVGIAASLMRAGESLRDGRRGVSYYRNGSTGDAAVDADIDASLAARPQTQVTADYDDYNYLPTVLVDFAWTDNVTIGAKFERTARVGGVTFNPVRGTVTQYDSEHSDSYDAFVRSVWLGGRLSLRASFFFTEISDQQVFAQISDNEDDYQMINAKRSHNYGLEAQTAWTSPTWKLWCSVGLLQAELDDVQALDFDYSGNDFPNAPNWTVTAGFIYGRGQGLFAEADLTARAETRADLDNDPNVVNERRAVVNARLGWAFDRIELSVFARNVFDQKYFDYHNANPEEGTGIESFVVGDPREIGVTVSVSL